MTTVSEVMAQLEAAGTEQDRKVYRRHGAREPLFGVAFGVLRPLAKAYGRDDDLARGLWATGNTDARLLACMVADPAAMTEADLDAWLSDIDYYVLVDTFVGEVASKVPGVRERWRRWAASDRDWTAQAGWDLVGSLALGDRDLDDDFFAEQLARIERELPGAGNRTRHAMNGVVIAIGIRDDRLRGQAIESARRIGPVEVDHGETGCVTPAAEPYIERTWARQRDRASRAGASRSGTSRSGTAR
jgi:3-methyladenine DNA glycosylase AlkD